MFGLLKNRESIPAASHDRLKALAGKVEIFRSWDDNSCTFYLPGRGFVLDAVTTPLIVAGFITYKDRIGSPDVKLTPAGVDYLAEHGITFTLPEPYPDPRPPVFSTKERWLLLASALAAAFLAWALYVHQVARGGG